MIGRFLLVALLPIMLGMFIMPSRAAAGITLGQAGPGGVTAVLLPQSTELGMPTNVYMGAMWNGVLFMRSGGSGDEIGDWSTYTVGPLPMAVANLTLSSAGQAIPVVNFDLAALAGLEIYVGYGSSEADLYLPGHLALIYTVPAASAVRFSITSQDVSGNCTLYSTVFDSLLALTGQVNIYTAVWLGGDSITLTAPGSNTFDYSYAEGGGTVSDHMQLTFDAQSRSISGSSTWTHTNGCWGYSTISGVW